MERLVLYRRMFHQYPEPGWLTFFATMFIAQHLEDAGYEVHVGTEIYDEVNRMDPPDHRMVEEYENKARVLGEKFGINNISMWIKRMGHCTGIVAVLKTGKPGKTKAYRFDMDALPIQESVSELHIPNQLGFRSENDGVFHACGHDGHMAIGLTLAEKIAETKLEQQGTYLFIFQPAEEGVRGANAFCSSWKFGNIDELYCCHIGFAPKDTFVSGAYGFLATTKMDVSMKGKSAHAGLAPERGRNALLSAAQATVYMEQIPRPKQGITRLNVGQLRAGSTRNTIPEYAWMQMETRGETNELNQYMKEHALDCIQQACQQYGVQYQVRYQGESMSASSSLGLAEKVLALAKTIGEFSNYEDKQSFGASDDGAVFMNMVQNMGGQAVYMLFGTEITGAHHETNFDFSEQILNLAFHVFYDTACENHK